MVEKKTSHLIAMAIQLGAQCYEAPREIQKKLFEFGKIIGQAFQIQDDLLEITSNPETMKKSIDSDIILGKKTYPVIIAQQKDNKKINELFSNKKQSIDEKTREFKQFFFDNNIESVIKEKIYNLHSTALDCIDEIKFKSNELTEFTKLLMKRNM